MKPFLYCVEAKEIQKYIFQTDKLKEMVGTSNQVGRICEEFMDSILHELNMGSHENVGAAAGWRKILFNTKEDAEKIYALFPFFAQRYAPGLQIIQALVEVDDSSRLPLEKARVILNSQRNFSLPQIPECGPFVEKNPRTGFPAITKESKKEGGQFLDRQTDLKRKVAQEEQRGLANLISSDDNVTWPLNIEEIAGESGYVAVIHADGNELGKLFRELYPMGDKLIGRFSEALKSATLQAVQTAYSQTLKPRNSSSKNHDITRIAARPIVLGGDDMTMITRGDLGLAFCRSFLLAFEKNCSKALHEIVNSELLKPFPKLTACAGIAFVKKNYPFSKAYELAESLCDFAKEGSKKNRSLEEYVPSSLAFHRVTSSLSGDYAEVREGELTGRSAPVVRMWQGPYEVGGSEKSGLSSIDDLENLAKELIQLPKGSIRKIVARLYVDPNGACDDFQRVLYVAGQKRNSPVPFSPHALDKMTEKSATSPLWRKDGHSPLLDALVFAKYALNKTGESP